MVGTLGAPMPIGNRVLEPNGRIASFEAVDIVQVDGDRISRKDTYLDAASLVLQLGLR